MSDWSQGYVVSTDYIFSYCSELNPGRCQLPLLNAGFALPDMRVACELGFGQGLSTAIHATTAPVAWWATDFHPSQTAFARQLIATSGCSADMYDQSFEEFCQRTDLPDFDFIGLHGVWSWIQPSNRQIIVDFIRRKLKVGGLCYISYNTQPGWAARLPFRHLLAEYAKVMVPPGESMLGRVEAAFGFGEKMLQLQPAFITANPLVEEQFHWIKQANPHYLAHEFFNQAWDFFSFSEIATLLESAKLTYAASANPLDHLDALHLTDAQQRFLQEIPDPIFQQTVRDFMVNQQFRQDYWIKGPRRLSPRERLASLRQQRVILNISRDRVQQAVGYIPGEVRLDPERYAAVLDVLADYRPRTIEELEDELRNDGIDLNAILHAILAMMSKNIIVQVQSPEQI
ncbi:MAG: class I SAM-dependent methyltransferase, partial [Magnetococcales bacterium]|nr:class I SAM-dependent methyltransferase [Magnetococcales bacterium]